MKYYTLISLILAISYFPQQLRAQYTVSILVFTDNQASDIRNNFVSLPKIATNTGAYLLANEDFAEKAMHKLDKEITSIEQAGFMVLGYGQAEIPSLSEQLVFTNIVAIKEDLEDKTFDQKLYLSRNYLYFSEVTHPLVMLLNIKSINRNSFKVALELVHINENKAEIAMLQQRKVKLAKLNYFDHSHLRVLMLISEHETLITDGN